MPKCPKCHFTWVSTTRSGQQNRYYWGVVLEILAEEIGLSTDEMHEILKHKFLAPREKAGFMIPVNTTQLTTQEFNIYIEKIQRWASIELNTIIPDPNEKTN